MDQIEVYKGVVPVHLGARCLGRSDQYRIPGKKTLAIWTRLILSDHLTVTEVNLNGQFISSHNFLFGVNSFYNHSDNNYPVDVEIPNAFGNPEPAKVRRFHDQFSNYLLNVYAGSG